MQDYDVLVIRSDVDYPMLQGVSNLVRTNKKSNILFMAIETLGGKPECGFRVMKLLNSKYEKIYAVVPNMSMSAGTLMVLGVDKIYMSRDSSLGPLDLQIEHPGNGSTISTLDVRDTMHTITSHAIVSMDQFFKQNVRFGLGKITAAKLACEEAIKIVQPIVSQIDPYRLHESFRNAELGATYGSQLLSMRMMRDRQDLAQLVSKHLANTYSAHNYTITSDEAKDLLQLSIEDLDVLTEWGKIKTVYELEKTCVSYYNFDNSATASSDKQKTKKEQEQ